MPNWRLKAVAQKGIASLPRAERVNWLFQRYVTRTSADVDSLIRRKLSQATRHLENWQALSGATRPPAKRALELGTGWYPVVPIALSVCGVEEVITVDRTALLRPNLADALRRISRIIQSGQIQKGALKPDESRVAILEELSHRQRVSPNELEALGIRVVVGDARRLAVPSASVEMFVSNNVLEHLYGDVLTGVFREYRRLAANRSVMSHFIDLADHYTSFDRTLSPRNFLRYSGDRWRLWNNDLVPLNRLQLSEYRKLHDLSGFKIVSEQVRRAPSSALDGFAVAPEFAHYPREELLITDAWLVSVPSEAV